MSTEPPDPNAPKSKPYSIFLEPRAQRDLDGLPRGDWRRVDEKILALADNPRPFGVEKLFEHTHRIRVGDWRVIFVIDDEARTVVVGRVKRRNERTYRD